MKHMKRMGVFAALALAGAMSAQVATQANSQYQTEQDRKTMAAGLGSPNRDAFEKPRELCESDGSSKGHDGGGRGDRHRLHAAVSEPRGGARRTRDRGRHLRRLPGARQTESAEPKSRQRDVRQGTETDPTLPEGAADECWRSTSYHHFDYPEKMLAGIHKALKPGGKLVVVEYYKRPEAMPDGRAMTHIRLDMPDVIKELKPTTSTSSPKRNTSRTASTYWS